MANNNVAYGCTTHDTQRVCYAIKGNFIDRDTRQNGIGWRNDLVVYGVDCRNTTLDREMTHTMQAHPGGGFSLNCTPSVVYDARGNGDGDLATTIIGDHECRVTDYTAICCGNGQLHQTNLGDKIGALNCMNDQQAVVYPVVQITSKVNRSNPQPGDPAPTLSTRSDSDYVVSCAQPPRKYIVRRLTPLECCRLQGFPDWWTDGVEGSDSAKYRMWGNGIALPCAYDVLRRIAKEANDGAHTAEL